MPTLRFELGTILVPGDRIGSLREATPGEGTYSRAGHVYSSAVGQLGWNEQDKSVSVKPRRPRASSLVLVAGQIVLSKVTRIVALQQVVVEIVAAKGVGALPYTHEGGIRKEDIRTGASEEVELQDCFRAGDFVLCRILSLGDSRRYLLTTAEPELGVVRAISAVSGKPMVPISWKEMQCPETKVKEPRKCAKVTRDLQTLLSG